MNTTITKLGANFEIFRLQLGTAGVLQYIEIDFTNMVEVIF
jgi:hypothetical protein